MKNIPIGEVLKEYGYITEEQLQQALAAQKQNRSRRLGEILEDMGFVTERQKLEALGQRMGLPVVDLATYEVDTDAVAKIPKQLALRHGVIAVAQQGGHLVVATSDPLNFYGTEEVRQITGMPVDSLLAEKAPIGAAIAHYYAEIGAKLAAEQANKDVEPLPISPIEVEEGEGDAPVVKLLASLLDRGYNSGASDIHVEPFEQQTSVRMRLDGVIVDFVTLSPAIHPSLITRIKILAGLDIAERRQPQDGHFRQKVDGQDVNIRVSIIPTIYGEKAVLRFLNQNTPIDRAGQFGMDDDNYQKFSQMLRSPHGIIYMTGPTGSGKTTTLYMILEQMAQRTLNISTIEDPVERDIFRINQMQVNTAAGLTFDAGLRALLRQDPDVIMVGETRDSETASISVRAAITGHLVFSTLHTNDALSAMVGELVGADKLIIMSDIDGLFDKDPRQDPTAQIIRRVEKIDERVRAMAGGAGSRRGTGGMITKIHAAEIFTATGGDMVIINGGDPRLLYDVFDGKPVGTTFVGQEGEK